MPAAAFPVQTRAGARAPLLRGGLLLVGRNEHIAYKVFIAGRRAVLRRARLERMHLSGVEPLRHFHEQVGHWFGHARLNQHALELLIGYLYILEIRLADRLANDRGHLAVRGIALSEQFASLFSVDRRM